MEHGGVDGGLSCGSELVLTKLSLQVDDSSAHLELAGTHRTPDEHYGVETFGDHLTFGDPRSGRGGPPAGVCPCPQPGSGIAFDDRGVHELKGVPGEWRLYAVEGGAA